MKIRNSKKNIGTLIRGSKSKEIHNKNNIKKRISKFYNPGNYEEFIRNIRQGRFVTPYCKTCKKNIWPPTDYCTKCFNKMEMIDLQNRKGKLIEILHSFVKEKKNIINHKIIPTNNLIGLVDFNGVRLLGSIETKSYNDLIHLTEKKINNSDSMQSSDYSNIYVKLKKCGIVEGTIFYEFKLLRR
jgi:uncharacterized OB-fold protein